MRKKGNIYEHSIDLKNISIKNASRDNFIEKLEKIPYRGYTVENISDGRKIVITKPGEYNDPEWEYYPETYWSRKKGHGHEHPICSSLIMAQNPFKNSRRVQDLVESHMAHRYKKTCREPQNVLEYLMVIADYLASRENIDIKDIHKENLK